MYGCFSCGPTGDLACNPGMCPYWESNPQPFGLQPVLSPLSYASQGRIVLFLLDINPFHNVILECRLALFYHKLIQFFFFLVILVNSHKTLFSLWQMESNASYNYLYLSSSPSYKIAFQPLHKRLSQVLINFIEVFCNSFKVLCASVCMWLRSTPLMSTEAPREAPGKASYATFL